MRPCIALVSLAWLLCCVACRDAPASGPGLPEKTASAQADTGWSEPSAERLSELIAQGEELWTDLNCDGCHGAQKTATSGPPLSGSFGTQARLADGRSVRRDEAYLLRAIDDPMGEVVDGYPPTMELPQPPDAEEAVALVCFIRSLGAK